MKKERLSLAAWFVILMGGIRTIVDLFEDNFITTLLMQLTNNDSSQIAIYSIARFSVIIVVVVLLGILCKRHPLAVFRTGIVLDLVLMLSLRHIRNNWSSLLFIAFIQGIALVVYYLPFNLLNSNWVSPKERHRFSGTNEAICKAIAILAPILLGSLISGKGYEYTLIFMAILVLIQLILAQNLKKGNISENRNFHLISFFQKIATSKDLQVYFLVEFLRGISIAGAQSNIITMLVYSETQSEYTLGKLISIIAIISMAVAWIFGRYCSKKHYVVIIWTTVVTQVVAITLLICFSGLPTIILENIVVSVFIGLVSLISTNLMFNISLEQEESKTEFFVTREIVLNIGRIISWGLVIVSSLLKTSLTLKISLVFIAIAFIVMSVLLTKIIRKQ